MADSNKTFDATNEWQQIKEGQIIPAGLHVRINLETGTKEAKLLKDSENRSKAVSSDVKKAGEINTKTITTPGNINSLSGALKSLPTGKLGIDYSPEKLEQIKRDFKSYNEIKESFNDFHGQFQTDAEIISNLIEEFRNVSKDEIKMPRSLQTKIATQLRILEDLNYLVHQIDNALCFIDNGGLDEIILPLVVNATNINLRIKAFRVLGAVTLNNPKAQIKVFEKNFGSHLSQILISSMITEELSSVLYAFGSLLRKFPLALQSVLSTSGTQALVAVLEKECELKVKAKALTFISDILVEKKLILKKYTNSDNSVAAAQYAEVNLSEWLQSNAFCETVDILLSTQLYELFDQPDLSEYFIIGLQNCTEICKAVWSKSAQLRHSLLTIKSRYLQSQNVYRKEIAQLIGEQIDVLYSSTDHNEL